MVTQLNGIVADMDPIKSFVKKINILVEDSAQGIGAFNGKSCGIMGYW